MLRTVVFDMGNVLLFFSHERMCRQIGELCGRPTADVRGWLFNEGWELAFERGDIDGDEFQRRIEQRSGVALERAALSRAASDIFTLNEPIVPMLDELRALGIRLVLLSNTHVWHIELVRQQYDVLNRFDDFVLSYAVGAVKPESAIFESTCRALGCRPDEAFYTDDIANYVEVGRQIGLHAEVYTSVPNLRQHLARRGLGVKPQDAA